MEYTLSDVEIVHDEGRRRFSAEVHGLTATLVYKLLPGKMLVQHTEVPPALQARGMAAKLTRAAFAYAREAKLQVVPACSYTAAFMAKHPEYNDLLPPPR